MWKSIYSSYTVGYSSLRLIIYHLQCHLSLPHPLSLSLSLSHSVLYSTASVEALSGNRSVSSIFSLIPLLLSVIVVCSLLGRRHLHLRPISLIVQFVLLKSGVFLVCILTFCVFRLMSLLFERWQSTPFRTLKIHTDSCMLEDLLKWSTRSCMCCCCCFFFPHMSINF